MHFSENESGWIFDLAEDTDESAVSLYGLFLLACRQACRSNGLVDIPCPDKPDEPIWIHIDLVHGRALIDSESISKQQAVKLLTGALRSIVKDTDSRIGFLQIPLIDDGLSRVIVNRCRQEMRA